MTKQNDVIAVILIIIFLVLAVAGYTIYFIVSKARQSNAYIDEYDENPPTSEESQSSVAGPPPQ
ncbi:hypothetical protein K3495_g3517 [Podosphaera aphanis]|nr:hypothetical protein K3495_g3517 [Podosphaera aphanis]